MRRGAPMIWWNSLGKVEKLAFSLLLVYGILQLFAPFYIQVDGHDSPEQLHWISTFHAIQLQGVLYPRWLNNSFSGFGAPTFYYYPPLTYFLGSLLQFLLPSVGNAFIFQLLGSLGTVGSFWGCWILLRRFRLSIDSSLLGAMIYAFAPYRFFDLFIRSAIGEHLAFAILPWLFVALDALLEKEKRTPWMFAMLSLGWAAMLLTNLPSAALTAVILPLYFLVRTKRPTLYQSFVILVH